MTAIDKEKIRLLRGNGLGYKAIAAKLGISPASVKSFCQRNGLSTSADKSIRNSCLQCGKPLGERLPGAEKKKFCSSECRKRWWNSHADALPKHEINRRICARCGREFFGRKGRKYCGIPCATAARFGGDRCDARAV